MYKSFPHFLQLDAIDYGPTCLRVIAKYFSRNYSLQYLRERAFITREGVSMLGISDSAESIGFRTNGVKILLGQLKKEAPLPCILHWNQNHFVALYKIKDDKYYIADPASQKVAFNKDEFKRCWISTKAGEQDTGTTLLLELEPEFYSAEDGKKLNERGLSFFFRYLTPYKKEFLQLILGMITVSVLQLITSLLTQSMVDMGIRDNNLSFITLILIAQLIIFVARLSVDFIRNWILLHANTHINISLISDFLAKLMRLPIHFFETKMVGDIMLRIGGHSRIESFMTGTSINTLFSFVNFPDQEFGIVEGLVRTISLVPAKDFFQVEIDLPDGLMTNFRKELPVTHEMKATAEIITEDLSLLEHFFSPLKKILKEGYE